MSEIRVYKKMQNTYTKNLVKLAKNFKPYDWGFMFDIVKCMIDNMYDYYTQGNNVIQSDESLNEVITQLTTVKESLKEFEESDFEQSAMEFLAAHTHNYFDENNVYKCDWDSKTNLETWGDMMAKAEDKKQALLEKAFNQIGKYLRYWWD